jgi:hypothetical protein
LFIDYNFSASISEKDLKSRYKRYLDKIVPPAFTVHDSSSSFETSPDQGTNAYYPEVKPDLVITRKGEHFKYAVFANVIVELKQDFSKVDFRDALNQITLYAQRIFLCSRLLRRTNMLAILADKSVYYIIEFKWKYDSIITFVSSEYPHAFLTPLLATLAEQVLTQSLILEDYVLFNGSRTEAHAMNGNQKEDAMDLTSSITKQSAANSTASQHADAEESKRLKISEALMELSLLKSWTYKFCGKEMPFPYLIYSSALSCVYQAGKEFAIKLSSSMQANFIEFEHLVYRRLQRYGVPFIARLECIQRFSHQDDKSLIVPIKCSVTSSISTSKIDDMGRAITKQEASLVALLFSTVGFDYAIAPSFVSLLDVFEAMNQHAFITHGDVRIENMICNGKYWLIDFSFSYDHAPYSLRAPFVKLLFGQKYRNECITKILKAFDFVLLKLEASYFSEGVFMLDSVPSEPSRDHAFLNLWTQLMQNEEMQVLLRYLNDNVLSSLQEKPDYALIFDLIKTCFIHYFPSIAVAKQTRMTFQSKYGSDATYPTLSDFEYLQVEVRGAILGAACFTRDPCESFHGLKMTASNDVLQKIMNRHITIDLSLADDLESLLKTICLKKFAEDMAKPIVSLPNSPSVYLEEWLQFEYELKDMLAVAFQCARNADLPGLRQAFKKLRW